MVAKLSQQIDRDIRSIGNGYKYVKYTYLYVDVNDKEKTERSKGDFAGHHEIGKPITKQIKVGGKVVGWSWEQMYQKD